MLFFFMAYETIITLLTVLAVLALFIKQQAKVELIAFCAVVVLLAFGILSTKDVLSVFSNSAAMTVATMFILSSALEKSGAIDYVSEIALKKASKKPAIGIISILVMVFIASAFVNNTSVVLVMIPVIIIFARQIGTASSKLLIPLSYVSVMGGACTLIGSSTNLLVDGAAQELGQKPFGMFEATIPALALAISGAVYLLLFGNKLLPDTPSLNDELETDSKEKFISHFEVDQDSALIGMTIDEISKLEIEDFSIIEIVQQKPEKSDIKNIWDKFTKAIFPKNINNQPQNEKVIADGDDIIIHATHQALLKFNQTYKKENEHKQIKEVIIANNSPLNGRILSEFNRNNMFGIKIIAIQRSEFDKTNNFQQLPLRYGDTLLIEGEDFKAIEKANLIKFISNQVKHYFSKQSALISLGVIVSVILLAAFNIIPIAGAGLIGVAVVIITGCISVEDSYKSLHGNVLFLIYFMLAISIAMQNSGALQLIVDAIMSLTSHLPPYIIVSILYLITSMITEVFSNNAAALMLTPIAIGLANNLGVDARPFEAAIMLGASASFATPIGYQTNTLVFNAGGYKFADFLRIGLPMNIILWIVASIVIPLYWHMF